MASTTEPSNVVLAACGLVCSECGAYRKNKCGGCPSGTQMYKSCPVRKCAGDRNFTTCAQCNDFPDLRACKKLNSFIAKVFGFIFRSNRIGALEKIRRIGLERFTAER